MPMLPFSPPPSVLNAYTRVDKATSEFLNCPDWRINIGICDTIHSKPWLAKDYIKAVRGRLQHKNPNVQLLSLTLLETIVKNCSELVHSQIAERKLLQEMIKIVKKKAHMRVREKILVLIDTWQEAFGGRGKITAHYYRAYEELRFPNRSSNTVPVITPPVSYGHHQAGTSPSTRHEPNEDVSLSNLESMRDILDLLSEMLQAVDPKDRKAVKDEVITDLYDQCRSNQKKLGYTLSSTTDEEILQQGIQFNEALQYVIEKYDAIATGSPVPVKPPGLMTQNTRVKHVESIAASAPVASSSSNEIYEEPNNSAPISSRCFETHTAVSPQDGAGISASKTDKKDVPVSDPSLAMALVPSDPPPPANKKTAEEDMIDLLSLALSPAEPSTSNPNQTPNGSTIAETQPQVQPPMNSYVVPWAQTQPQLEYEPQQPSQTVQQQSNYIPPPWAPTPGYYCNPYASNHSPASYYNNGSGNGAGSNQYIPSYRLFEDLNVLGNLRTSGTSGASGSSMLGARK
ncbi:hypothetical protein L1987_50312 [Smallanthus sonchifolius]|uniref:Uncharacterized protein n=1 Tax=Smallanthus sonchifolius TaxID=185202 RepID=A0ACB9EMH6_9ASTR|nr:hypothetical protein L1987_50312 [Smallanthus sonchifolius]